MKLNRRTVVVENLAGEMHHPDDPFNKRGARLVLLVGLLSGGDVEAVKALAKLVHGDGNDLAEVLVHDERHAHSSVLGEKHVSIGDQDNEE